MRQAELIITLVYDTERGTRIHTSGSVPAQQLIALFNGAAQAVLAQYMSAKPAEVGKPDGAA